MATQNSKGATVLQAPLLFGDGKYLIAFRLSDDRDSEWREVTATDRETAQYVYDALLPLPRLHSIELYEWRPGGEGVLRHYAPGGYVVLSARGGLGDE
jgi:hypothetical protein